MFVLTLTLQDELLNSTKLLCIQCFPSQCDWEYAIFEVVLSPHKTSHKKHYKILN